MRDDQQYQVTVQRGDDTTVLRAADPDVPPALAALVSVLQARAEPTRGPLRLTPGRADHTPSESWGAP